MKAKKSKVKVAPGPPKKRGRPFSNGVGITLVEFAKRDGCSVTYVSNAVKDGRLERLPDRSIDPALVGTPWRAGNRKKQPVEKEDYDPDIDGPRSEFVAQINESMSLAAAERAKMTYEALKRKRLHDTEIGRVVLIEDVADQTAKIFHEIRTKILSIPSDHAVRIAALKTAPEVQHYLRSLLTKTLEKLVSE